MDNTKAWIMDKASEVQTMINMDNTYYFVVVWTKTQKPIDIIFFRYTLVLSNNKIN
jgi:hypothetical protein